MAPARNPTFMAPTRWLALVCTAPLFGITAAAGSPAIEEIRFTSQGVTLAGSIVVPTHRHPVAAVVFIHGSGPQSRNLEWARRFASDGIVALVYDKRGAGESGGEYEGTQSVSGPNISLLADDAVAAAKVLASQPRFRALPLGFTGISQAGWIAPLAAVRHGSIGFMALWSAPVCKVSEEDIYSKYTGDADVDPVPGYAVALAARTQKYIWPDFLGEDTDPATSLRQLSIPGLWIFSDNDASIPVDLSLERLRALRQASHRYDYVLFSGLGHDNMEHTFLVVTEWIRRMTYRPVPGRRSN